MKGSPRYRRAVAYPKALGGVEVGAWEGKV
jgi:hypothetical protein